MWLCYRGPMQPRLFVDDCPASPSISRLRAKGEVTAAMASVLVAFGEGADALRREIRVVHRTFPNGGQWAWYVCPECAGFARLLRWHERPLCRRCLLRRGLRYRIESGTPAEKGEARRARIERLRKQLEGGPARLRPRKGRVLERRTSLQASLRRALVAAREGVLR